MSDLLRFAEHITGDVDPVPVDGPGTFSNPFVVAPPDWSENGLPYGAWCRCVTCGQKGRSTVAFDFYAKVPGEVLVCETCQFKAHSLSSLPGSAP